MKFISATKVSEEIKKILLNSANISQNFSKVKFDEAFDWGFLKMACFVNSNKKNHCDSFVKLKADQYYNVMKIYDFENEMMLLEKVLLYDLCPIIELSLE